MGLVKVGGYKRGYDEYETRKEEMEQEAEARKKFLQEFYLTEKDPEATITFLTDNPVTFDGYRVPYGKGFMIVPSSEDLEEEMGKKPSFFGAYLVFDHREYTSKAGGKEKKILGAIRLYIVGLTNLGILKSKYNKKGLLMMDYDVERHGSGKNTSYSFDYVGESELTVKKIKSLLPEALQESYTGKVKSLEAIIEEQLEMREETVAEGGHKFSNKKAEDDDEDDEKERSKVRARFKHKEADLDEDEDDEEEPPKKRSPLSGLKRRS